MATPENIKFKIQNLIPERFSLLNVIREPRSFAPDDIEAACNNLHIEEVPQSPERLQGPVLIFLRYLFNDFFKKVHQSGLYNRQRELFDAIGKAENGEVELVQYGMFFNKSVWPCHDITLSDKDKNPLIVARIVDERDGHSDKSNSMDWLRNFTDKMNKLQTRKGTLGGGFFAYTGDFPADIKTKVETLVQTSDPSSKYDCRLPAPAMVPLNLLEITATTDDGAQDHIDYSAKLILPQLK